MKKIPCNTEFLRLAETMNGRELALHYEVSEAFISKLKKKLAKQAPPDSLTRLSKPKQVFALALAEGATKGQAAAEAFDISTPGSAAVRGSLVSREPDVQLAVADLLAQVGLTKRRRAERLADMVECQDLSIVGRGLELSYRLENSFSDNKIEINIDLADAREWIRSVKLPGAIDITPPR